MRKVVVAALFIGVAWTGNAEAFCFQGSDVNGALQYLVCLHNEQAQSINSLTDTVNNNASIANLNETKQSSRVDDLESQIRDLEREISDLRQQIANK